MAAYDSRIKLRPDRKHIFFDLYAGPYFAPLAAGFGYAWSAESFHWQDLIKRPTRSIVCKSAKEAAFRFQAYAIHDKSDPLVRLEVFLPLLWSHADDFLLPVQDLSETQPTASCTS